MPDLKIIVGADTTDAVKNIDNLTDSLTEVPKVTKKVEDGLKKVVPGINQAGQALTNLGRVAQDAPFGFIGIQNNLNPLLESFQRLRAETGSNMNALKALGSSLIGAGGIGLALSLVSSGILLYQKYFQGATDETKKNAEAIKVSVDEYDKFRKELEQVTAAMGTEAAKVSILFSALSDSNLGLRERKGVLEQLNQISPGYLGNLDKEKASYEDIAKAVFAYTDSLAKSSEIKALLPQVDKLFQSLINAQVELNQLRRFGSSDENFFGMSPEDLSAEEKRLTGVIKSFTNQIKIAKAGLSNFAGGEANLSEILFGKTPELAKQVKEKVQKLKFIFKEDTGLRGIELITSAKLILDADQAQKEMNDKIGKVKMTPIKLDLDEGDIIRKTRAIFQQVEEINQQAADNIKTTLNSAFASIGESIAESLGSGADFGKTVFGNLFKVLGQGLKQLGEAMIAIGTAKIALEKFKFAPGIGTVVAGIAAVALGALLQKAIPGFAQGVENFGGGLAVVGERGPELVRLPRGSDVIPNHRLGGISGAGAQVFIPDIKLRGSDMVVVFNRASQTIGRNG